MRSTGRPARVLRDLARSFPRSDVSLWAAGLTFFGVLGIVPIALGSVGLAAAVIGPAGVTTGIEAVISGIPGGHGVPEALRRVGATAVGLSPVRVLVVLFLATVYGEGLRRAFLQLAPVAGGRFTGWRGRVGLLPLLLIAPLLVLVLLAAAPLVGPLYARGGGGLVLGVVIAFHIVWIVVSLALASVYRFVPRVRAGTPALLAGSFGTGAVLSGFLQGFLLFLAIPVDWSLPFGGLPVFGAVTVSVLWLYLLHLIVLVGYRAVLVLDGVWVTGAGPAVSAHGRRSGLEPGSAGRPRT